MIQMGQHSADTRFKADEAAGCQIEFLVFFFPFMGCMVGNDSIDGAVFKPFDAGIAVDVRADRRIHFVARFKGAQGFIGKDEVLRRNFCRNLDAALFSLADEVDGVLGADVGDVDRCSRRFCQEDVAGNGDVFGNGRTAFHAQFIRYDAFVHIPAFDEVVIFAVVDDDLVEHAGIFHGFTHEVGIFDVVAVIGKSDDSFFGHRAHGRQFLALLAFRNGADNFYLNLRFVFDLILQAVDDNGRIDDRFGVRHGATRVMPPQPLPEFPFRSFPCPTGRVDGDGRAYR